MTRPETATGSIKTSRLASTDDERDDTDRLFASFYRQIRNFVLDMTEMPPNVTGGPFGGAPVGIHWQVSQGDCFILSFHQINILTISLQACTLQVNQTYFRQVIKIT
jgi:hypothetical protein